MSRIEKAIEKANQLREKGHSPAVLPKAVSPEPTRVVSVAQTQPAYEPASVQKLSPINPHLVINCDPAEGVAEEYRKLKSVVFELTRQQEFKNTLLVTSDLPECGKSLTALNLALTLAREYDHTVLLVDTDLRKPMIHKYLGIEADKGLVQCLTEDYPLEKALIRTGIGKLVVLPAGGTVDDPAELLASNRMSDLIAELKARYSDRYVIFDSTPLLPFAEAKVLGSLVDGVLFVVRERKTRHDHLREALGMLKPEQLLGIVYNDVDRSQKMSHYRYRYY